MTVKDVLKQATEDLSNSSTPRLDVLILLEKASGKSRAQILADQNKDIESVLDKSQLDEFNHLISRRSNSEPIAYIINHKQFYSLDFFVDENVIVPRPETEKLVQYTIDNAPQKAKVLDVGTGSGAIAISIKKDRPDINIYASDISDRALGIAAKNAASNKVSISFIRSDLLDEVNDKFDYIVANLPYIPNNYPCSKEVAFEPQIAIFSNQDGLEHIFGLLDQISKSLKPEGVLLLETLPEQYRSISKAANNQGLEEIVSEDFMLAFKSLGK
ncbi:MAG: peptide chain release factor N(5)-glutamine methyltransferase [Candidatus Saccharimonadales bacterium]